MIERFNTEENQNSRILAKYSFYVCKEKILENAKKMHLKEGNQENV